MPYRAPHFRASIGMSRCARRGGRNGRATKAVLAVRASALLCGRTITGKRCKRPFKEPLLVFGRRCGYTPAVMSLPSDVARALARFEFAYARAVARPGAPVRLIRHARHELLLAIETLPEAQAVALVDEGSRYIRVLAGHRNGGRTPSAAA